MKKSRRHSIALFLLSVYVPVVFAISFIHSHGPTASADTQQVTVTDPDQSVGVQADLLCVICKFLSSHSSVVVLKSAIVLDVYSNQFDSFTDLRFSQSISTHHDRAPPFLV